jgi:large subunit ribosomal protein L15
MQIHDVHAPKGASRKRKRVGCGPGSGHGKTATRGSKGQKSRSGSKSRAWFEGGQMPFQRRVPKRGFKPLARKTYQVVNLGDIDRKFEPNTDVGPVLLAEKGLVKKSQLPIKILAKGDLTKPLSVKADAFSQSAKARIEAAGGTAEVR